MHNIVFVGLVCRQFGVANSYAVIIFVLVYIIWYYYCDENKATHSQRILMAGSYVTCRWWKNNSNEKIDFRFFPCHSWSESRVIVRFNSSLSPFIRVFMEILSHERQGSERSFDSKCIRNAGSNCDNDFWIVGSCPNNQFSDCPCIVFSFLLNDLGQKFNNFGKVLSRHIGISPY